MGEQRLFVRSGVRPVDQRVDRQQRRAKDEEVAAPMLAAHAIPASLSANIASHDGSTSDTAAAKTAPILAAPNSMPCSGYLPLPGIERAVKPATPWPSTR